VSALLLSLDRHSHSNLSRATSFPSVYAGCLVHFCGLTKCLRLPFGSALLHTHSALYHHDYSTHPTSPTCKVLLQFCCLWTIGTGMPRRTPNERDHPGDHKVVIQKKNEQAKWPGQPIRPVEHLIAHRSRQVHFRI
jgi:hypothetical protein